MRIANSLGLRRGHRCSVRVAFVSAGASLAATLVLVLVTLVIASFAVPGVAAAAASVTDPGTVHTYAYDIPPHLAGPTDTTVERGPPATYNDATMYDADGLLSLGAPARSNAAAIRGDFDYDDLAPVVQLASRSRGAEGRVGSVEADLAAVERSGVAAKAGTEVAETCLNSFTGTTLVLMADGTKKPIRDVKLGDWVMAADPKTGETGPRKVIDLIRHSGPHTLVAVRLSDGSTIDATDKHPFWVETRGEWVDAIDLQPGDVVIDADGDRLTVTSLGISEQDLTAYNLTVDGLHTYFAGSDSVLVHNAGCMSLADALATTHGQERLAARGFDNVDIAIARSSNLAYEQADGAIAHVAQLGDVYNVVVVGERGVVTGMKGLTENQLGNLARNYGWSGYP